MRGFAVRVLTPAVLLVLLAVTGLACSVPVFRYALERWPADHYRAVIFHRGLLTPTQQAAVDKLGPDGPEEGNRSNIEVRLIDMDDNPGPEWIGWWEAQQAATLPWLAVMYPPASGIPLALTAGPLDARTIEQLVDSPVRAEVARRLLGGETSVWILLEIGDKAGDDAAEARLSIRLKHLEQTLELPTLEQEDIENGLVSVSQDELQVKFSVIRVSRDDPAEKALVRMLLGTEEDLRELEQTMVFPVFGRGRALYALVGPGINNETVDQACTFLVGACSCEAKEINPGVDLLITADWDHPVTSSIGKDREIPELSGLAGFQAPPIAAAAAPQAAELEPDAGESSALVTRLWTFGGAGLILVLGASVVLLNRKSK